MKTYTFIILITPIFLLSGCTGEPSEQNIHTVMNRVVEQTNAIVKSIVGRDVPKGTLRGLKPVEKHDYVKVSDKSYKHNVTAVVNSDRRTATITMIRTDDDWQAIER